MSPLIEAIERIFDILAEALLIVRTSDDLKARIDKAASKRGDEIADAAEEVKFGPKP